MWCYHHLACRYLAFSVRLILTCTELQQNGSSVLRQSPSSQTYDCFHLCVVFVAHSVVDLCQLENLSIHLCSFCFKWVFQWGSRAIVSKDIVRARQKQKANLPHPNDRIGYLCCSFLSIRSSRVIHWLPKFDRQWVSSTRSWQSILHGDHAKGCDKHCTLKLRYVVQFAKFFYHSPTL